MTELASISETRRKAVEAFATEVGACLHRLNTALKNYQGVVQSLARHEALGETDIVAARKMGRQRLFTTAEEEEYICVPYWRAYQSRHPFSIRQLAKQLGCGRATVDNALKRYQERHPELVAKVKRETRTAQQQSARAETPQELHDRVLRRPRSMQRAPESAGNVWDQELAEATRQRQEQSRRKMSLEDQAFDDENIYGSGEPTE